MVIRALWIHRFWISYYLLLDLGCLDLLDFQDLDNWFLDNWTMVVFRDMDLDFWIWTFSIFQDMDLDVWTWIALDFQDLDSHWIFGLFRFLSSGYWRRSWCKDAHLYYCASGFSDIGCFPSTFGNYYSIFGKPLIFLQDWMLMRVASGTNIRFTPNACKRSTARFIS